VTSAQDHEPLRLTYLIDGPHVDRAYRSIVPELGATDQIGGGLSVKIYKTARKLVICIKGASISSCRAATNSWLRLALVASEVDELITEMLD
jgi:tRNA threonylcarbamoyladenosine modification (KEOPS) complex  Pcc1 subunit